MQQSPPPLPSPKPPAENDAFSVFVNGFRGLPGRIIDSPKPEPSKWYDHFPIIFAALFFCWPLGVLFVWLTKRFTRADKWRLASISMMLGCLWGYAISFEGNQPGSKAIGKSLYIEDSSEDAELEKVVGYSGQLHRLDTLKNELENADERRAEWILVELCKLEPQRVVWKVYSDFLKARRLAAEKANEVFGDVAEVNGYYMEPLPYDPVSCRSADFDIKPTSGNWKFHITISAPKVGRIEITKRIIRYLAILSHEKEFQAIETLDIELRDVWRSRWAKTLAECEISLQHLRNNSWEKSSIGEKTAVVQSQGKLSFAVDFQN